MNLPQGCRAHGLSNQNGRGPAVHASQSDHQPSIIDRKRQVMEKEAFSVLWNGQASAHYAGVRRQRAPYNVQALDYSVSTEKPLIHHLTSAMDDGRLESDPGYNGRLGHVCFWFQSPCTLHVLLHNSLSFGGARLASYIMGRCLTIPKSRVTDSATKKD